MSEVTTLSGFVVPGDGRGRIIGFPTANLACSVEDIPCDGVYAATVRLGDSKDTADYGATLSVGTNPTFDGERERRVEVYVHDVDFDLYGRLLRVRLVTRLRPTIRFDHVDALIAQTERDVTQSRLILTEILAE